MGWNNFYWVPYFNGKGLVYYEFFGLIASIVAILLALSFLLLYFFLNKLENAYILRIP